MLIKATYLHPGPLQPLMVDTLDTAAVVGIVVVDSAVDIAFSEVVVDGMVGVKAVV